MNRIWIFKLLCPVAGVVLTTLLLCAPAASAGVPRPDGVIASSVPTTSVRTTPVRTTPSSATPVRATPVRATPVRATPVRATPANEATSTAPSTTVTKSAPAPALSISIDNGHTTAAPGEKLSYTITVKNLDARPVTGLLLTQSMPTGLKLGSADAGGTTKAGNVVWRVDLKAAGTATVHTTMAVFATGKELLRLASVACASVAPSGAPIVCASHSDQLPAGAAAAAATAPTSGADRTWWYVGGGIILIVVAALVVLVILRRRAAHQTVQASTGIPG